ncbi:MAG: GNAT family N-acetyltransferase [Myxococcales bacterium]
MTVTIRAAEARDLSAVSVLAGLLVRQHHEFDALRFMLVPNVEAGYARFFKSQLTEPGALILVAERDNEVVGYAYARLEPRDWNNLLDACGALHDIFVSESVRRQGVARLLVEAVRDRLREQGAPRVVLHTASKNATARHFFASVGFRETMIEMTCEL